MFHIITVRTDTYAYAIVDELLNLFHSSRYYFRSVCGLQIGQVTKTLVEVAV